MAPSCDVHIGSPQPLGVSATTEGTNFAIYARDDEHATLLLFQDGASEPTLKFKLDAAKHRSGHVWHCEVLPAVPGWAYLWRIGLEKDPRWRSNDCLDPYAKLLDTAVGPSAFNNRSLSDYSPRALVPSGPDALTFDWDDVAKPKVPWDKLVVYEMHVRGFSKESTTKGAGTFAGVIERIPYLQRLGVNCVELLPVFEFNEREWSAINPDTGNPLCQYWGYSTVAFFAAMNRFGRDGSGPEDVVRDFKLMVRELHRAGIEVFLDVVYNHTAEMGLDFKGPGHYGMKTLAPFSYYILKEDGHFFVNHTGCGNTINCNNLAVQDLIVESVRYWSHEMQVDGFRFDLASVLCRGTDGEPVDRPPVVERLAKDASLRDVKLIAEAWDCGGLYQVGNFPHFGAWGEWNGKFRDAARRFIKGDRGLAGDFAARMCGSEDMYAAGGRRPYHSVNFVTAHDGFSLRDMVSYNSKRNHANGENNNDGEAHNDSWNCGVEGDSKDEGVNLLRARQIRNMLVAVLIGNGTPMLRMGDEYGLSQSGNNNGWCQDGPLSWFSWDGARSAEEDLLRFTRLLVKLRTSAPALQRDGFLTGADITWHGAQPHEPRWDDQYNFLAFVLHGKQALYVAFNAGPETRKVRLPSAKGTWCRVIDTNLPAPRDFTEDPSQKPIGGCEYELASWSAIVLTEVDDAAGAEAKDGDNLPAMFDTLGIDGSPVA